jgi:hypothetical protein
MKSSWPGPVLALAAGLVLRAQAQEPEPPIAAPPIAELFLRSLAAGPDSAAAGDVRRRADAVPFLVGRLDPAGDERARLHAMELLMRTSRRAEPAVPALLQAVDGDGEPCHVAIVALGEIGPFLRSPATRQQIAERVVQRFGRAPGDPALRIHVARTWSRLQVPFVRDVAVLLPFLRGDNPFQIELACQMLADLGAAARPAMPVVAELVRRPRFPVRALDRRGEPGIPCAGDRTAEVRLALFVMAQRVDPEHEALVPLLLDRLRAAAPAAQPALLQQLGRIGPAAGAAVPVLVQLAQQAPPVVAREAVTGLGMIGAGAAAARAALAALQTSADAQVAARARAALRRLGDGPR